MDEAIKHCMGLGIWEWGNDQGAEPDVVMACCGDKQWKPWRQLTSYGNTCLISRFAVNIGSDGSQPKSYIRTVSLT